MSILNGYLDTPTVHAEIIDEMSPTEKNELINELNYLIQNNEAMVNVSCENGFKHLFKVLTGKDKAVRKQINLDQKEINKMLSSIMMTLNQDTCKLQSQQFNTETEMLYIKKMLALHSMYLIRITQDMEKAGISTADPSPLIEELKQEHDNGYRNRINIRSYDRETLPYDSSEYPEPTPYRSYGRTASSILDKYIHDMPNSDINKAYNSEEIKSIPEKIARAKKKFGFRATGKEIGLIDVSLLSNGNDGYLFTSEGLAYDYAFSKIFVRYEEIDSIEYGKKNKSITINGYFKDTKGYIPEISNIHLDLAILKKALEELRSFAKYGI